MKISLFLLVTSYFLFLSGCTSVKKAEQKAGTSSPSTATPVAKPAPVKVEKAAEVPNRVVCTAERDERAIQVVKAGANQSVSEKVCDVVYTKFSKSQIVGGSSSSLEFCEDMQKRIQSNLENGGFKCTTK